ncbi:hypothetical protein GDO86_000484 [Hymenochirus boettgeri]|uniref:UDENN FNIP1/2-type domain-containing protein n=1 Tax=Hymenochirus boettgeri TaxID=247094 RepID=A0A8T2KHM8_9PIPI|nr:hypothetical protein GDO86_000484 [Hymenochirus boettgeri]
MAQTLLQKLFCKRNAQTSPSSLDAKDGPVFSRPCSGLDLNCIRLIVYQDCERRGRQILFDSKAVREIKDENTQRASEGASTRFSPKSCQTSSSGTCSISSCSASNCFAQTTNRSLPRYQYTKPASDVSMLGEMIFGSVAMSYKGSTLKIHFIRCPPQLMISKVFSAKVGGLAGSTTVLPDSFENMNPDGGRTNLGPSKTGQGLCQTNSNLTHSTPVDMPSRGLNEDKDSGIARSASLSSLLLTPLPSPSSSFSSSYASSYQRRWLRSQTTSLENGVVPRWTAEESFSMSDESYTSNPATLGRKKIAISIIFSLPKPEDAYTSFQDFFFSHFPLFESHVNKLKSAIEKAMISCRKIAESSQRVQFYLSQVMEALGHFRETVWNLYSVPRVAEPVWLTMMSNCSEKSQLCQHFLKEVVYLSEQLNKNQFFAALLTAVLTYHLAWVPTVMPNGHPPIKSFSEKHASQSVSLLAKSHPYNPLWAQLGDLYGAIGSPVRLTRTVVVGKRKDLVQRILYILTYFIRCSELQENHLVHGRTLREGEQIIYGSKMTTSLERGEVEDSEYVIVTVNNEPALVTPLPNKNSAAPGHIMQEDIVDLSLKKCNLSLSQKQQKLEKMIPVTRTPTYSTEGLPTLEYISPVVKSNFHFNKEQTLSNWSKTNVCKPATDKVTFMVGCSPSPDFENCRKGLEDNIGTHCLQSDLASKNAKTSCNSTRTKVDTAKCSFVPIKKQNPYSQISSCSGCTSIFDEYFVEGNGIETNILDAHLLLSEKQDLDKRLKPSGVKAETCVDLKVCPLNTPSQDVSGCQGKEINFRAKSHIPRNESCDSALGNSDDEITCKTPSLYHDDWSHAEVELPLPRSDIISNLSLKNYGRSLFGGYCSTYMPDMVIHGIDSDEKLRQGLTSALTHATNQPVLDEPIAEAICIVADTDRWSVQVASSQKKYLDNMKLGTDVLVSSQVSSLLQSILQLYKLRTPPVFCIMHLEDKLQEMYFKSKMLSEYLRGNTRVPVKELGVVLGIDSSDLPLLAAVASTHSPHVAQILL